MVSFDDKILRKYDIRGVYGPLLNGDHAKFLGQAVMSHLDYEVGTKICVSYDGRLSSPSLVNALIDGLVDAGAHVLRLNQGPTPMMNFAVKKYDCVAGLMVTGSHNPPDQNGFKMALYDKAVDGTMLKDIVTTSKPIKTGLSGTVTEQPVIDDYIQQLGDMLRGADLSDLKIAWDCANGAVAAIIKPLTDALAGEHVLLYSDLDGTFPNHPADPSVAKNMEDLQALVKNQNCDLGFGFDGDGDRVGVVDHTGKIVAADIFTALLGLDSLKRKPKSHVIFDIRSSQVVVDKITEAGGVPILWKAGHSLVKPKMKETNAVVGGELSGHIYIGEDYHGFDDGPMAAVLLLGIIGRSKTSLHDLVSEFPEMIATPEIRIRVTPDIKARFVPHVHDFMQQTLPPKDILKLDGIRAHYDEGWFVVRPASTEDVISLRIESKTEAFMTKMRDIFVQVYHDLEVEDQEALAALRSA